MSVLAPMACVNAACVSFGEHVDVRCVEQHGRLWLVDNRDGECPECGTDMASADYADELARGRRVAA